MKRSSLLGVAIAFGFIACDNASTPTDIAPQFAKNTTVIHEQRAPIGGWAFGCTEIVNVPVQDGYHIRVTQQVSGSEVTQRVHVNFQALEGVGMISGDKYQIIEANNQSVEFDTTPPFPYEQSANLTFRVIGQGSGDNYHVHQLVTFSWDGTTFTADVKKNEAECRG